MRVIDVVSIFQAFNGPRGVVEALKTHQPEIDLPYNTVQMWWQRRQIPSRYTGAVLWTCKSAGLVIETFLVEEADLLGL